MSLRRQLLVSLLLAGCGRFGFGETDDRDASIDAPEPIVPLALTMPTFSATGSTFVDVPAATFAIPPSVGKRWLIVLSAAIGSSNPALVSVEARYLVDGVERGIGATQNTVIGRPGPWQHFFVLDGTTAAQQLTFQLREVQDGTAVMNNLNVVAVPLDPSALVYASSDAVIDVTSFTRVQAAAFNLGALQGDYVFMMLANASDLPGESDVYVEWAGPAGEVWYPESQQPREPRQSFFTMQRATVDTPDAVVRLYSHGGSGQGQLSYARVVALRADAFSSVDFAIDATAQVTTSSVSTQTVGVAVTPGAAEYLFVGSMRVGESCNAMPDADRAIAFTIGSSTHSITHQTDNCAYEATYGHVELLPTAPPAVSAAIASGNGFGVQYYASQVLVLGLR